MGVELLLSGRSGGERGREREREGGREAQRESKTERERARQRERDVLEDEVGVLLLLSGRFGEAVVGLEPNFVHLVHQQGQGGADATVWQCA